MNAKQEEYLAALRAWQEGPPTKEDDPGARAVTLRLDEMWDALTYEERCEIVRERQTRSRAAEGS